MLRYAAVLLVSLGVGYSLLLALRSTQNIKTQTAIIVKPGENKATLTLANGKTIILNAITNGKVATFPGGQITNNSSTGMITYIQSKRGRSNHNTKPLEEMNTITTPNGGQYHVILSDGTHVYLNASSTLKFPSCFISNQRQVTLTGEGYFEVAKNQQQPFQVTTKGQQLTVTGTHFNVSAYNNEPVKTTLLEGGVNLLQPSTGRKQPLVPNQQAMLLSNGFEVKTVKAINEIAWKRGLFYFRQTPLKEALQQISRWYNVEVDYSNLPDVPLDAELTRDLTLNKIIQILDLNADLKFELTNQGRRLVYIGK